LICFVFNFLLLTLNFKDPAVLYTVHQQIFESLLAAAEVYKFGVAGFQILQGTPLNTCDVPTCDITCKIQQQRVKHRFSIRKYSGIL